MKTINTICIILFLVSICSCNKYDNSRANIINFSNISENSEVLRISNSHYKYPITAICFQTENNYVFTTYSGYGSVVIWDTNNGQLINDESLNLMSTKTVQFTNNCTRLLGASEVQNIIANNLSIEYIFKINIWDTKTSNIVNTYSMSGEYDYIHVIRSSDNESPNISKIVFSPKSNHFAIGYMEGGISINGFPLVFTKWIEENNQYNSDVVDSLQIDPTEKYIARISNSILSVWEFSPITHKLLFNSKINNEKILTFDQTGKVLLVAGNNHITIWDIEYQTIINELIAYNITSLIITQDNKNIIWGNENGEVSIIAVE
jgi:WD40 repeat protein